MKECVKSFIEELNVGFPHKTIDSNLARVYEYQQARLDEEGLEMRTKINPGSYNSEEQKVASWKDTHYQTSVFYKHTNYIRSFYKKGEKNPIYTRKGHYLMYSDVTECLDYSVAGTDSYICPNCGSASTLQRLSSEGCAFCGTRFSLSELYPKVSCNYLVYGVFPGTPKEMAKDVLKVVIPVALLTMILIIIYDITNGVSGFNFVLGLILGTLGGAFYGYILWFIIMMVKMLMEAGRAMPKIFAAKDSTKEFTQRMRHFSEDFSYEYFTGKVVSMLKAIIYSSRDDNLPFYTGTETTEFDHVVESTFSGALGLESFKVEGNIITVQTVAFVENFYNVHGTIIKRDEKVRMTLKRDISKKINYHFNIRAVNCPSCASSFDALKNKHCPYCGSALNMLEHDWVVSSCRK